MRWGARTGRRLGLGLVLAALASLLLAPTPSDPPSQKEIWKAALAEVDQALETNPHQVSEESLASCRAMRKTAALLYKMGQPVRAYRRLKACRRVLGLEGYQYGRAHPSSVPWST
jgi:hypothetical protein